MDYQDRELLSFVMKSLKQYGRQKRAVFIKFDPGLLLKFYTIDEANQECPEDQQTRNIIQSLEELGCQWSGTTVAMSATIQPRHQANVVLQENQLSVFPKHTKRLLKDASNRGVVSVRGTVENIPEFSNVVALTETRKGVNLRNQEYFKKIMDIYGDDAYLHLAKVNIPKRLSEYQEQLSQIEKDLSETAPHQKKRLLKLQQQKNQLKSTSLNLKDLQMNILKKLQLLVYCLYLLEIRWKCFMQG